MAKARPRPKTKAAPRARILDAALAAFAAYGVRGSSIQDVAERVGMSKQALMHHFPTKEALRHAVYATLAERLRAVFPAVAGDLVSRSHSRYAAIIDRVTRQLAANPDVARFISFELLDHPRELTAWLRTEVAPWLGLIVGVVEQNAQKKPRVDPEAHVTVLALTMLAVSALMPRLEPKLHKRVLDSSLEVMQLGSRLDLD